MGYPAEGLSKLGEFFGGGEMEVLEMNCSMVVEEVGDGSSGSKVSYC